MTNRVRRCDWAGWFVGCEQARSRAHRQHTDRRKPIGILFILKGEESRLLKNYILPKEKVQI